MATPIIESDISYEELYDDPGGYRDEIATVDNKGNRNWLFPKQPKGRFYQYRTLASIIFLVVFFATPFIKVKGYPLFLFNLIERKFVLFGQPFWPQDFHLFVLAMVSFFVFVILFTVVFGRLWCGWACPQTVFMEMVFRRIEYWIEGSANQQRKLAQQAWDTEKILKKGSKWAIFLLISFLIANTFASYLYGVDEMAKMITRPPAENWSKFGFVAAFTGIFFFVFAWFREQACLIVCPYGRLQGVLLGKESMTVIYDWVRGEPRGRKKKTSKRNAKTATKACSGGCTCGDICGPKAIDNTAHVAPAISRPLAAEAKALETPKLGDCVDCKLCVQVCPTGIDIRNGTQMECVNCTACMDACDGVMEKLKRPKGLIRIDSHKGIESQTPWRFTPRVIAYVGLLCALLSVFGFSLASRSTVETTMLRARGQLYQKTPEGDISNLYTLQIANKSTADMRVELYLMSHEGKIQLIGDSTLFIPAGELAKGAVLVSIPRHQLDPRKTKLTLELRQGAEVVDHITANFFGP